MENNIMISKLIKKISTLILLFVLFMGISPLTALGNRERKTEEPQKPKQEEYKGKGSRAYNQSHPYTQNKNTIKRNPVENQALKRDVENPAVVPVAPGTAAELQQQQILQSQELMMQQLTPQQNTQNTNSNSQQQ